MQLIVKLSVIAAIGAVAVLAADTPATTPATSTGETPAVVTVRPEGGPARDLLTNEGLVVLSEAGFSDAFIVRKIFLSRTRFDTSAEGLAYLRRSAISEELATFVMEYAAKPGVRPAEQSPTIVPVKVARRKVLVPIGPPKIQNAPPLTYAELYGSDLPGSGWPAHQVVYATPGRPVQQSPVYPASAPVLTPPGSGYAWSYGR